MHTYPTLIAVATAFSWYSLHSALAQEPAKPAAAPATPAAPLPKCPITGKDANLALSAPTREGPVFFCSKDCIEKFKADQAKYTQAVGEQRKLLAQRPRVQVKCPVSGNPPDSKVYSEKDGQKIFFCSEDCRKKYAADSSRYASALANSYTFQVKCPVMKETINPTSFTKLPSGQTVYYCCKGCDDKLLADPAKYAPILKEQGYTFDFTK